MNVPLDPDVARLAALLGELAELMHGRTHPDWEAEVRKCQEIVARSDGYGAVRFLGLFGGMGSLNDIILQKDGVVLISEDKKFGVLKNDAYLLAQELTRETPR